MPESLKIGPTETLTVLRSEPDALEVEAVWGPGSHPPPKHFHPDQDERFEVRAGRLRARIGDEDRELGTGETIDIPRGTPHQMWNPGQEEARALWRTSPAGRTLQWFESLDALQREGRVRSNGLPSPLAFATLVTEFRDVIRLAVSPEPIVSGVLAALAPLGRMRGYGPARV
jgi:mannose-6-phosphate isomerase-like protein (cupin superfamily)